MLLLEPDVFYFEIIARFDKFAPPHQSESFIRTILPQKPEKDSHERDCLFLAEGVKRKLNVDAPALMRFSFV